MATKMVLQLKDGLTSEEIESLRTVIEKFKKVESIAICEAVEHVNAADGATGAATISGLYNCDVCGQEKCLRPGICNDCLTPPTDEEIKAWGFAETPRL